MKIAHAKILQFQSIGPEITLVDDGSQQNQRLHHRHFDAQTLSRQKSIESSAVREYEQTRSLLNKALLQLEVLSKTPIISQPTNPTR